MDWQGWLTLTVVVLSLAALARELAPADVVMMAGLFTLAVAGVLTPEETFAGFSNQAMLSVQKVPLSTWTLLLVRTGVTCYC